MVAANEPRPPLHITTEQDLAGGTKLWVSVRWKETSGVPRPSLGGEIATRHRTQLGTALMELWPAALRLDQAAEYSGLSLETFKAVCPVKPDPRHWSDKS
jgi:hypothetical protein